MATELYELLAPRLDVFFYPECQDDIVGTDGEKTFGDVFRDKCRVAVVFYREGWGGTGMTRAEESAIKQRGFAESYEFCVWVPLGGVRPPSYVPPQLIWADWETLGAKGLASAVIARVQEAGARVRPETPLTEIARLRTKRETVQRRSSYEVSEEAADWSRAEFDRVAELVDGVLAEVRDVDSAVHLSVETGHRPFGPAFIVQGPRNRVEFVFTAEKAGSNRHLLVRRVTYRPPPLRVVASSAADFGGRRRRPTAATGGEHASTTEYHASLDSFGAPAWSAGDRRYKGTSEIVRDGILDVAQAIAKYLADPN